MDTFRFQKVNKDDPRFEDILALRYRIYCEQKGFENPEDHPGGLERDALDDHAVHFAAFLKETDEIVGTIRLILNSGDGFPIENHFEFTTDIPNIDKSCVAEVSRLAITSQYCTGFWKKDSAQHCVPNKLLPNIEVDLTIGLIKCITRYSRKHGITHWYAVMARALHILLKRKGIKLSCIGPDKDYHGMRGPYFGAIENVLVGHTELYNAFTEERAAAELSTAAA